MDNNFSKILDIFKRLNEDQFGPAATAAIQQGKSPNEVSWADLGDKQNQSFAKQRDSIANLEEGPLDELYGELGDKYDELAPGIEKYKDEAGADRLYKALGNIAQQHGLSREFRNMCAGARYSAHQDYDTNPGHFKNWFWYLPFAKDLNEGSMTGTEKHRAESIEEQMAREWTTFVNENVPTASTPMNPVQAKADALAMQHTATAAQKLKGAGVDIRSPQQTAQTVKKAMDNVPIGQLTPQDKATTGALAKGVETVMAKGDPVDINQITNTIKKVQGKPS
jgi:hypothetical protein